MDINLWPQPLGVAYPAVLASGCLNKGMLASYRIRLKNVDSSCGTTLQRYASQIFWLHTSIGFLAEMVEDCLARGPSLAN